MNNIRAVISSPCHHFSSPLLLSSSTFFLCAQKSFGFTINSCSGGLNPHDCRTQIKLGCWLRELWGKVCDFCFVSFALLYGGKKKTLHRNAVSRDWISYEWQRTAKHFHEVWCSPCLSCFLCCPSFYSVWHVVGISVVICCPVEVECLLCFVYFPPWCPRHFCSVR